MKGTTKAAVGCIAVPVAAVALIAGTLGFAVVGSGILDPKTDDAGAMCGDSSLSVTVTGDLPSSVAGYGKAELERAAIIMKVGEQLKVPARGQLVALMTAMQESDLGRDRSSLQSDSNHDAGLFQQRVLPGWYGSLAQVIDPAYGARVFYQGKTVDADVPGGAGPKGYHIPGLLDIKGWQTLAPTVAAQRVQVSAFPDAYAKHEDAARQIMTALSGVDVKVDSNKAGAAICTDGGTQVATGDMASVIAAARSTIGIRYRLGGGSADGPTNGEQDCSGLTSYAFKKGMGILLPRNARGQWAALKSNAVPVDQLQPGDLIFEAWGGERLGPGVVSHVAIYLGNGQMIEAKESAGATRISPVRTSGYQFIGAARVPKSFKA